MIGTEHEAEWLNELSEFVSELDNLHTATDVEIILIAAAVAERSLVLALNVHFLDVPQRHVKRAYGSYGPLETLSGKALVARLFGIISEAIFDEINALKAIRNRFAHDFAMKSLEDPRLTDSMFSKLALGSREAVERELRESVYCGRDTMIAYCPDDEIDVVYVDASDDQNIILHVRKFLPERTRRAIVVNSAKAIFAILGIQSDASWRTLAKTLDA